MGAYDVRVLGTAWGDPSSPATYSGVPYHLFQELERRGATVDRASANIVRPGDVLRGAIDVRRSLAARRPRRNAAWRYLPRNIDELTRRFARVQGRLPAHDVTLQFGVAGIPAGPLVAHVEIPVQLALTAPVFARSYGFDRLDDRTAARAIEGERQFLASCDLVWTNSSWTAAAIEAQGVPSSAIAVCPPACGVDDPGPIQRDWSELHVLFIGKDWAGKGGPLLLEAFAKVRSERPGATLTVVGCNPSIDQPGVNVLGYLRKDVPEEARALQQALRHATVFAMPSHWESFGIVYLEAAMYGLPVVMLAGQGREDTFPASMAVVLPDACPGALARELLSLASDVDRMRSMGEAGRAFVHDNHTWPRVAETIGSLLERVVATHRRDR
jgi:glycosyltransferase involved in cell wall biosynthesis